MQALDAGRVELIAGTVARAVKALDAVQGTIKAWYLYHACIVSDIRYPIIYDVVRLYHVHTAIGIRHYKTIPYQGCHRSRIEHTRIHWT